MELEFSDDLPPKTKRDRLVRKIKRLLQDLDALEPQITVPAAGFEPTTLQDRLQSEGNLDLIATLKRAQAREPGYGTVVVPREGFSESDDTHNAVLDWLEEHQIHTINVFHEVENLKLALRGRVPC